MYSRSLPNGRLEDYNLEDPNLKDHKVETP
jgi:hypothetical protein